MSKGFLLLDVSHFNDELASQLKDFVKEGEACYVLSFSQPVAEKIKNVLPPNAEIIWTQDILTQENFAKIDEAAYQIIRNWHQQEDWTRKLVYQGVNLGITVEHELALFLPQLLKKIKIVKNLLTKEKPEKLIIISESELLSKIVQNSQELLKYPLSVKNVILKNSRTKNHYSSKETKIQLIKKNSLARLVGFITWLKRIANKEDWPETKPVVLLRNPKQLANLLPTKDYQIVLIDEKVSRQGWSFMKQKRLPYYILNRGFIWHNWLSKKFLKKEIISLGKVLRNNYQFKKIFSFEGVNFWPLVEDKFKNIFKKVFPIQIDFIEAVDKLLQKTKPALVISTPGVTSPERVIFELAKKYNIPTLDIQHGLIGDQRGREIIYACYIAVWGKGTKKKLTEWGNNPDSIFVTGNYNFEKIHKETNFINRKKLCKQLKLNSQQGIFIWATGAYFCDPLPYLSAILTKDEGEITFRVLLEILKEFPQKQLVVKLHPMENSEGYLSILNDFPYLKDRVRVVKKVCLYGLLKECELLFTYDSTVALEAMFFNKPIIVISLTKNIVPMVIPFSKYGSVIEIRQENELIPAIKTALDDKSFQKKMKEGQANFINDFAGPLDGKSKERILEAIQQIIYKKMVENK